MNIPNESKKAGYQINIGNKNNPPTTSFAESGYVENSLVASMFERTEEDERNPPRSQHKLRASEPTSPNTEFGKIKVKMYSATQSPGKGTDNHIDEDSIIIKDTPLVINNKDFKEKLTKAFLQAEDPNVMQDENTKVPVIGKDMLKRKETAESSQLKQQPSFGIQGSPKAYQSSQKASQNISLNDLDPRIQGFMSVKFSTKIVSF